MIFWAGEIKELDNLYSSFKGHLPDIVKELEQLIRTDDPNVVMLYSRRCLEVIVTDLCENELKRPRKTEPLKGIIDKLNSEEKVPSHIIASMHSLNSMSTYGTHPKDFDPEQVKPVLINLAIIIKWYLKYKDFQIVSKTSEESEKLQGKILDETINKSHKPKSRVMLLFTVILLVIVIIILLVFKFVNSGNKKFGNNKQELQKSIESVQLPTVETISVTNYTSSNAIVGGKLISNGGTRVTDLGVYWSITQNPETSGKKLHIRSGSGDFSAILTGLVPKTIYYIKAYAINSQGTGYGDQVSFTTSQNLTIPKTNAVSVHEKNKEPLLNDTSSHEKIKGTILKLTNKPEVNNIIVDSRDGQQYKTVKIGNQVWFAENLKATKFNDGTDIPLVKDSTTWAGLKTPGYCWYKNDEGSFKWVYGALYNWYSVNTGKLCPIGWHVPLSDEWHTLETLLGGKDNNGGKLKETGTTHWVSPNAGATNEYGFTALPGGCRDGSGWFVNVGIISYWWIPMGANSISPAGHYEIHYSDSSIWGIIGYDNSGFSVRCLKDN
jgi:uncharacterized protein (TIGR02145 family)